MLTRRRKGKRSRKGGGKYGPDAPLVLELSVEDPIIVFSEGLKQQLIEKVKMEKYDKLGWFRKEVTESPGWFSKSRYLVTPEISTILPLISEKLTEHGLPVKEKLTSADFLVEIEYANAGAKPVETDFIIHTDNDGGIKGKVHTFMVYLDMDCDGGELGFYSPNGKFIESFDGKSNSKTKKIIMYDGGLYNNPQPITHGKYVVVSYQIRQAK